MFNKGKSTNESGQELPEEFTNDNRVSIKTITPTVSDKKGQKLPKTATSMYTMLLLGAMLILIGAGALIAPSVEIRTVNRLIISMCQDTYLRFPVLYF